MLQRGWSGSCEGVHGAVVEESGRDCGSISNNLNALTTRCSRADVQNRLTVLSKTASERQVLEPFVVFQRPNSTSKKRKFFSRSNKLVMTKCTAVHKSRRHRTRSFSSSCPIEGLGESIKTPGKVTHRRALAPASSSSLAANPWTLDQGSCTRDPSGKSKQAPSGNAIPGATFC